MEIKQGELFSLLGVNGAGKTTTIKMLTCLAKPTGVDAVFQCGYREYVSRGCFSEIRRRYEGI